MIVEKDGEVDGAIVENSQVDDGADTSLIDRECGVWSEGDRCDGAIVEKAGEADGAIVEKAGEDDASMPKKNPPPPEKLLTVGQALGSK